MKSETAKNGGVGIIVALALVLVTYLVGDAVSGPLLVTQPGSDTPDAVQLTQALVFTVVGGAVGIGLALVATRLGRPRTTFVAVSVVALGLYGIMAFVAADTTSTAVWLNAMHLAAALPIVGLLARSLPERRTSDRSASEPQRIAR
jgi:peptidoglycan/LPS O-acetylase OafA/YrhL